MRRLAVAVRAGAGIECLVWLVDIAGLSQDDAVEQMVWSAVCRRRCRTRRGTSSVQQGRGRRLPRLATRVRLGQIAGEQVDVHGSLRRT